MQCPVELDKLVLFGNYNSPKARSLMVVFEECDPSWSPVQCKEKDQIQEWMKDKYIIVLSNHEKFIPWKFDEDKIEKQSSLDWYAMTNSNRADYPTVIYR